MISPRLRHALVNRLGAVVTHIAPPPVERFDGTGTTVPVICVVGLRYEYRSIFGLPGYEYRRFLEGLKKVAGCVWFVPLEMGNRIMSCIREVHRPGTRLPVISVFQQRSDVPDGYFSLREEGCILLNWYTDDDMQFDRFSRFVANEFDQNITTYAPNLPKYKALCANVLLSQWAGLDNRGYRPQRGRIAAFIGRMYGGRAELARRLSAEFADAVFIHDSLKRLIPEEKVLAAYSDSICAVDEPTSFTGATLQIKGRIFENASLGNVVLTKPNPELEAYFEPAKELIYYDSADDLVRILRDCVNRREHYLGVGYAAYQRAQREHTYEHRFRAILKHALACHGA
jgi:glycosyl transferase family 1